MAKLITIEGIGKVYAQKLQEAGIALEDGAGGTTWRRS